jgi:hypothetical protein
MNLEKPYKASQQVNEMLVADEQATAYDDTDPLVAKCPSAKEEEPQEVEPFRLLMWHIKELGGGFFMPESRPDHCIDAYASLINKLDIDICVIIGVKKSRDYKNVEKSMEDGSFCLCSEPPDEDTGVNEVNRILKALKQLDAVADWKSTFLKSEENDSIIYLQGNSTCFLYKAGKGIEVQKVELLKGKHEESIGLQEALVAARFLMPLIKDADPLEVPVLAPLAVLQKQDWSSEDSDVASSVDDEQLEFQGDIPDQCIVALSTSSNLIASLSGLNRFRAALDIEYQDLLNTGSVLNIPHWERITNQGDAIIDNLQGVNPTDLRLQDQSMHWEALESPDHPDEFAEIIGHLSDLFLLRNGESIHTLLLDEMQVVDMIRAASASTGLKSESEHEEPLEEDGILAGACKKHVEFLARAISSETEDEPVNLLSTCIDFVRLLSEHWPVVVTLSLRQ